MHGRIVLLRLPWLFEGEWLVLNRSFKHLLGETSLEQKCRFFFGMVILLLVSVSFFWYGQKTEGLLRKQTTQTARMLVLPTLLNLHYKSLGNTNVEPILDEAAGRPAQPQCAGARPPQAGRPDEAAAG